MNNVGVPPLSQFAWVNTDQRKLPVRYCFSSQCAQCRWHKCGGISKFSCCKVSVTGVNRTIQSRHCAGNRKHSSKSVSLAPPRDSLKTDDYSSSIELDHFISAHVCRGLFLPSVLAYQSTLFIFIKEQNGNFDKTSTSCISLFEVFWRYCV